MASWSRTTKARDALWLIGLCAGLLAGCSERPEAPWGEVRAPLGMPSATADTQRTVAQRYEAAIEAAASEYDVPVAVLEGLAVQGRDATNEARTGARDVGPFLLRAEGPGAQVREAMRLAGLRGTVDDVASSVELSAVAAAAWLRAHAPQGARGDALADWWDALAAWSGLRQPWADAWVADFFASLDEGMQLAFFDGSVLSVQAVVPEALWLRMDESWRVVPPSPDYGPANYAPACSSNYTKASRGPGDIHYVVIHVTQGSYSGAVNWFQNCSAHVSAHYVVRSSDGAITQSVLEKDIAWHAGNWKYNTQAIGIEHEGYIDEPQWFSGAMYAASAELVANICLKYGIPIDRKHIIGHIEVPGATHTDPGPYWDWDTYMALVSDAAGGGGGGSSGVSGTGKLLGFVREGDIYNGANIAGAQVVLGPTGAKTTTGANGLYVFDAVPPGDYTIEVTAPGYAPATKQETVIAGADNWASVALEPLAVQPGRLLGFVREGDIYAGSAIAGATVTLQPVGLTATTDANGLYVFENVEPGDYTVTASAQGYASASAAKHVEPGVDNWASIALQPKTEPTGVLKGVVREGNIHSGANIGGATVVLDPGGATAKTGFNGFYIIEGLAPGTYTVTASAPGYLPASVVVDVTSGQDTWGSLALQPVGDGAGTAPGDGAGTQAGTDSSGQGGTPGSQPSANGSGSGSGGQQIRLPADFDPAGISSSSGPRGGNGEAASGGETSSPGGGGFLVPGGQPATQPVVAGESAGGGCAAGRGRAPGSWLVLLVASWMVLAAWRRVRRESSAADRARSSGLNPGAGLAARF